MIPILKVEDDIINKFEKRHLSESENILLMIPILKVEDVSLFCNFQVIAYKIIMLGQLLGNFIICQLLVITNMRCIFVE